jgi:hypothetical protein
MSILQQAGFRGEGLRNAWAVVMKESSGRPDAFNGNQATGDQSYGLFQINMLGSLGPARRKALGLRSNEELFDPLTNARAAFRISKGGTDFGAWGVGPNAYRDDSARFNRALALWPGAPKGGGRAASAAGQQAAQAWASGPANAASILRQSVAAHLLNQATATIQGQDANPAALLQFVQLRKQLVQATANAMVPQATVASKGGTAMSYSGKVLNPGTNWAGTHVTDGLDWNHGDKTAVDIMARAGTPVGAPEAGTVVRHGSAQGGQALYFQGRSGTMYWLGHIDNMAAVGTAVRAGQPIALISADHPRPHLHIDHLVPRK